MDRPNFARFVPLVAAGLFWLIALPSSRAAVLSTEPSTQPTTQPMSAQDKAIAQASDLDDAAEKDLSGGHADKALAEYTTALDAFKKIYGDRDDHHVAETLAGIGESLYALNRDVDALPVFQSSLAMLRRLNKDEYRHDVAFVLSEIGNCQIRMGNDKDALASYQESLDIISQLHPNEDNDEVAWLNAQLACCLHAMVRDKEALPLYQSALEMRRRLYKKEDQFDLANNLNDLANCLHALNRDAEAVPLFHEAIDMFARLEKTRDCADVATVLGNLGSSQVALSKNADALATYQAVLAIQHRLYPGQDRREIAETLNDIGNCFHALNRETDAIPIYKESVDMYARLAKTWDNSDVAVVLNNLGTSQDVLARYSDALFTYRALLSIDQDLYKDQDRRDVAETINKIGNSLHSLDRDAEAIPLYQASLEMYQRICKGKDDVSVATLMGNIAGAYLNVSRFNDALTMYEGALTMQQKLHGDQDHADVALALTNVATALDDLGRDPEALPMYQAALAMYKRLDKNQDAIDLAEALHNTALCLKRLGQLYEAQPLYQASLDMFRRVYKGKDQYVVATCENDLAICIQTLGHADQALPMLNDALQMRQRLYQNKDSADSANSLNNVGCCYQAMGRFPEALKFCQDSVDMEERLNKNQDRSDIANSMSNVAEINTELGRDAAALPIYEQSLAMRRRLFNNKDHPDIAFSLNNIARCLDDLGRSAEALPMYQESLAMRRRIFGQDADHPDIAESLNNVAYCLNNLGRPEEAKQYYIDAAKMRMRIYKGHDHPSIATSLGNIACCLNQMGESKEALPYFQEVVAMDRRLYPNQDHPFLAGDLQNVAACLDSLGRGEEALPIYKESLEMFLRIYGQIDHPRISMVRSHEAQCLYSLGRFDEALPLFQSSVDMAERLKDPALFRYASDLGRLDLVLEHPDKAVSAFGIAIDSLEDVRENLGGDDEDRMGFMSSVQGFDPYGGMVRAQLALNQPDAAAEFLDRGRARSLLDILERAEKAGDGDLLRPLEEKAKLTNDTDELKKIKEARDALHAAEDEVRRLKSEIGRDRALNSEDGQKDIDVCNAELNGVPGQPGAYQRCEEARRAEFNLAGPTTLTKPATILEIQSILQPHQHLLMYSISYTDAVLLVVRPSGQPITGVYLTGPDGKTRISGQQLKELIRQYRLGVISQGLDSLRGVRTAPHTRPSTQPAGDIAREGYDLFLQLMPPSIWQEIQSDDLVYVMPDSSMAGLPLEMLISHPPVSQKPKDNIYWLDDGPPVSYGPSAAAVLELRRQEPDRTGRTYTHEAVLLGDPILQRNANDSALVPRPLTGAQVNNVQPGSAAEEMGMKDGAIILAYGSINITSMDDFAAAADKLALLTMHGKLDKIPKVKFWQKGYIIEAELPVLVAEHGAGFELTDASTALVMRNSTLTRYGSLTPLPGTREEVLKIYQALTGKLFSSQSDGSVVVLLGEDATIDKLMEAARGTRYLHLATHGLVQTGLQAIYSSVVLSQPTVVTPQNTGVLTLQDLFDHWWGKLSGTELVVLSACDSEGLSDDKDSNASSNDGVFGLPWGFMYAGSPAVVASLWEVQDASTAKLMEEFYGDMHAQDHDDKLAAFTAARKQLKKDYPEPFFWAPFIYLGDPN